MSSRCEPRAHSCARHGMLPTESLITSSAAPGRTWPVQLDVASDAELTLALHV